MEKESARKLWQALLHREREEGRNVRKQGVGSSEWVREEGGEETETMRERDGRTGRGPDTN